MTTPTPIRDLTTLLTSMKPEINPGIYAWCLLPLHTTTTADLNPIVTVREAEGLTVVIPENQAVEQGYTIAFRAEWITLRVHSDLNAVGLTAAFSRVLADAGISCNVVAGVHHDHVFVPAGKANDAIHALLILQQRTQ